MNELLLLFVQGARMERRGVPSSRIYLLWLQIAPIFFPSLPLPQQWMRNSLEYASSARAKCGGPKPCQGTTIQKGELRVGRLIDFKGNTSFAWRHWGCATKNVLENMKKSLDGFEELKPEDQAKIVKGHVEGADIPDSARKPAVDNGEDEEKTEKDRGAPRKEADDSEGETIRKPKRSGAKAKKSDDDEEKPKVPAKPRTKASKYIPITIVHWTVEPKEEAAPQRRTPENKKDWDGEDSEESGQEFSKKLADVQPESNEEDKPKKASAKTPVSETKAKQKKKANGMSPTTTPPSTHWELHLSVTRTSGNRTLPTSSPQWRTLRAKTLRRDKRNCSACGYHSPHPKGRYMVVDHANGDASNNHPSNLRIHCLPCDAIRHCGFAGSRNWLVVGESSVPQVEIVRKTREMFERTGAVPDPQLIDLSVVLGNIDVSELASMARTAWKDLPEERRRLRGFFTSSGSDLFERTTLTEMYRKCLIAIQLEHSPIERYSHPPAGVTRPCDVTLLFC